MTDAEGSGGRKPGRSDLPRGSEQVYDFALNYPDIFEVIAARAQQERDSQREVWQEPQYTTQLIEAFNRFTEPGNLKPGDLVRWKQGLRNRRRPEPDEVAVVVAILPEPVYEQDKKGANSPYFREPLDLVVGMLEDNGDLILYHFDSRRFEPANSKDAGH